MAFTNDERKALKILVEKELAEVQKQGEKIFICNSPFLGKVAQDEADLPFLKSEVLYQQFLESLLKKL